LSFVEQQLLSGMRKRVFVKQRQVVIVMFQVVLIVLSATFAWLLRFEFAFPQVRLFLQALPLLVAMRLLVMKQFNLFHGYERCCGHRQGRGPELDGIPDCRALDSWSNILSPLGLLY
jgi:hypothetical protein